MGSEPRRHADPRSARGRAGEQAALDLYLQRGFGMVVRNWRCRAGEIDLIVERAGLLVFCEVKTRAPGRFGAGFEAVTADKQARLRRLAERFLTWSGARPTSVRFDVASVAAPSSASRELQVELFEDAF